MIPNRTFVVVKPSSISTPNVCAMSLWGERKEKQQSYLDILLLYLLFMFVHVVFG